MIKIPGRSGQLVLLLRSMKVLLVFVIFLCVSCGSSVDELAAKMVVETLNARATGTAVKEAALAEALTQVASEAAPSRASIHDL